jgi:hypothetical protein
VGKKKPQLVVLKKNKEIKICCKGKKLKKMSVSGGTERGSELLSASVALIEAMAGLNGFREQLSALGL